MRQSTKSIFGEQRDIREIAEHFTNINLKINKNDVKEKIKNEILPAGTVLDVKGKLATGETAFGILFEDVDFNNSTGTEVAPVLIHGFVNRARIEEYTAEKLNEETIKQLKMIKFL